jgi:hypothetical protein
VIFLSNYKLNYTGAEINTKLGYVTQNMAVGASPTLIGLTLSGLTANRLLASGSNKNIISSISYYNGGTNNLILGNTPASISGSYNMGIGQNIFTSLTSGYGNMGAGWNALISITTSEYNTAWGYSSLRYITTAYNTAIGSDSGRYYGYSTDQNVTSSSSTYLGALTRAGTDGNTNETVVGFNSIGNGSNTVTLGNSSVTSWYMGSTKIINQAVTTTSSPIFAGYTITGGVNFSGAITNLTIVNGQITAAS